MSDHDMKACEVYESEEVFDVVFPSCDESSEVVHPGKESLYFPSLAIASKLATILGSVFSSSSVRRDQFDPVTD
jgi:hypothetical protein